MIELLHLQAAFTVWLQSLSPALDSVFGAVNFLQTAEFMLIALPIVWWCIDKRVGAALVIFFCSGDFLSRWLKSISAEVRPYDLEARIRNLDPQPDSSFPSAGMMATMLLWGYLSLRFRNRALWVWSIVAIVLVGLARIYLGAHYLTDVLASVVIAAVLLALAARGKVVERIASQPRTVLWIMAIGWPVLLAIVKLNPETAVSLGAMLGFAIGLLLETQYVRFDVHAESWKQIAKVVIGLAMAIGLRFAIKPLLPAGDLFTLARYAVIGLWMAVGAPWLFVALHLAGREQPTLQSETPLAQPAN